MAKHEAHESMAMEKKEHKGLHKSAPHHKFGKSKHHKEGKMHHSKAHKGGY